MAVTNSRLTFCRFREELINRSKSLLEWCCIHRRRRRPDIGLVIIDRSSVKSVTILVMTSRYRSLLTLIFELSERPKCHLKP
jgi:hypothetical protein